MGQSAHRTLPGDIVRRRDCQDQRAGEAQGEMRDTDESKHTELDEKLNTTEYKQYSLHIHIIFSIEYNIESAK